MDFRPICLVISKYWILTKVFLRRLSIAWTNLCERQEFPTIEIFGIYGG